MCHSRAITFVLTISTFLHIITRRLRYVSQCYTTCLITKMKLTITVWSTGSTQLSYHSLSEVPSFEVLLQQFTEVEIVGCKVQIEYWVGKTNPAVLGSHSNSEHILLLHNSAAPKESNHDEANLGPQFLNRLCTAARNASPVW